MQLNAEVEGLLASGSAKRSLDVSIRAVIREASPELKAAVKECLDSKPHVKEAAKAALAANPDAAAAAPELAALVNRKKRSGKIKKFIKNIFH